MKDTIPNTLRYSVVNAGKMQTYIYIRKDLAQDFLDVKEEKTCNEKENSYKSNAPRTRALENKATSNSEMF